MFYEQIINLRKLMSRDATPRHMTTLLSYYATVLTSWAKRVNTFFKHCCN